MGKVLKVVAVIAAVAVIVFAPQISAALLTAVGVTSSVATALLATALAVGAGMVMRAVQGSPSTRIDAKPQIFSQSITDSFILYGRRRTSFLKWVFFHPRKVGKRHFRYFVFAVAGHRVAGNPDWMLNDEAVTVDGAGKVTSGKYANAVWLWFQRGLDSETANATFVSECGGKWTAEHKGNNIAAIYMKVELTDDVVEAGFCTPSAIIDGKDDVFDFRTDTAGYTNNAALVFYDWLALPREEGGFGAYPDEIPPAEWISAQANVSDETVEEEARYALDCLIVTGSPPIEVRDQMVVNCAGSYTYSEGFHLMRVGYWVPPSVTLDEADLAGPIQVSPFLTGDVAANEVQGTYISPADGYQGAPFATKTLSPPPPDRSQLDLDLPFVTSKYRAERIATIMLRRAQCEKTVTWPMNIAGVKVSALNVALANTARYGLSNYAWVVTKWDLSADFGVILNLREENEDIYADPSPVAPASVPAIDKAEPVLRDVTLTALVSTSFTTDADPPDGLLQGTDATITVETHTRTYDDKTVSVDGDVITGLSDDTLYHVYYDDEGREGGAVVYQATQNPQLAATSPANPGRHYVGSLRTDTIGGSGTSGGGASPPGWGGGYWNDNVVEP